MESQKKENRLGAIFIENLAEIFPKTILRNQIDDSRNATYRISNRISKKKEKKIIATAYYNIRKPKTKRTIVKAAKRKINPLPSKEQ